jgi:16S rRNA (adenine1518-N6/adenine1519-N6)-dimethyltransferase
LRPTEIKTILAGLGVSPTKSKGQNFLTDDGVADREVAYLDISPEDTVLEVGPGLGVLTARLVPAASKVIGIELDHGIASYVRSTFSDEVELIEGDALEVKWPRFDRFISNIPYSISSPLIFKLLEHDFRSAVIMVQKEFADRMVALADTDDYSRLSVSVYYRSKAEMLEKVGRTRFWPEPEVDSAVVRLTPRPPPFTVKDERMFHKMVEMLFSQRRKKISTTLKSKRMISPSDVPTLPYMDERVEALTPEQIGELVDAVYDLRERSTRSR